MPDQTKKYPIFTDKKPSELFVNIVTNEGTPVVDCGYCGRVLYDASGEYLDEDELKEYEEKHALNPNKYIPCGSIVYYGHFLGKLMADGCPCNAMRVVEDQIWASITKILEYAERRSQGELEFAQRTLNAVKKAKQAQKALEKVRPPTDQ